jgi:hypothetical protein
MGSIRLGNARRDGGKRSLATAVAPIRAQVFDELANASRIGRVQPECGARPRAEIGSNRSIHRVGSADLRANASTRFLINRCSFHLIDEGSFNQ